MGGKEIPQRRVLNKSKCRERFWLLVQIRQTKNEKLKTRNKHLATRNQRHLNHKL
jgi:hypothetical protein